jgi:hypothetical protein
MREELMPRATWGRSGAGSIKRRRATPGAREPLPEPAPTTSRLTHNTRGNATGNAGHERSRPVKPWPGALRAIDPPPEPAPRPRG